MGIESKNNGLIQIAKDAVGITAYQWVQDEQKVKVPAQLRRPLGLVYAGREFIVPAFSRVHREVIGNEEDFQYRLTGVSIILRDSVTNSLPFVVALAVAANITDIPGVTLASLMLTKFVLNGLVHYEFSKFQPNSSNQP